MCCAYWGETLIHVVGCWQLMKEDDNNWPEPDRVGRQELEIVMGNEHISFTTSKIGSLLDVQSSKDPEGLRIFYYLVQVGFVLQPFRVLEHRAYGVFLFECCAVDVSFLWDPVAMTQLVAVLPVQDLKCFVFSLIGLHFKIKPI